MSAARWVISVSSGACEGLFVRRVHNGKVCLCNKSKQAERFATRAIAESKITDINRRCPTFGILKVVDIHEAI